MSYSLKENDLVLDSENAPYVLRVRDLPVEDKPREKLLKYGPDVLSVGELLAIILNAGTRKEEVLQMASRILKEYGEKNIVNQKNPQALQKDLRLPLVKACQVVACFELGRRFFKENVVGGPVIIKTAKQAFDYLRDMRSLPKEHLRGIYLNSRYRVIHDEVISVGSLTSNIVHPREIFRPAFEYSAAAVIIAHNHPSGSVKATRSDKEITKQLIKVGEILGIELLDHLIIAGKHYSRVKV